MLKAGTSRRAWLATIALVLALMALSIGPAGSFARPAVSRARSAARENLPNAFEPQQPRLAYLTETATSTPKVWLASASGGEAKLLGPGQQPLLAPNGQSVAVSLFGTAPGVDEHGPSIGIYPASGAAVADYLNLETSTATPLAWSPDSRYLAIYMQSNQTVEIAAGSSLDVIDTQSGTVKTIAQGAIYGASFARDGSDRLVFALSHSLSPSASTNLYESEADGAGVHRITSDGRSLEPLWGPTYIAYDRERMRHLSPEYQIWLATPAGVRVRKLTHIHVGALVQGLVPLAFSAGGSRLLAEFEGQDTSAAYAVNVVTGRVHSVTVHGQMVQGAGISSDGSTLLLDEGSFEQPPSHGRIVTVPFAGGRPKVLVAHGAQASWND
ncbi:MAG: hypothetical protein ABSG93_15815 [Solirubrobacteraceae bacterium]|jgi:Tol biopolymer transport system component